MKKTKELNIEKIATQLDIDKENLDEGIARLPALYFYYGEKWAHAIQLRDAAKVHADEVYAIREKAIRLRLSKSEEKVTEAMVKSEVERDERYREAFNEYLECKRRADTLTIVKEAFEQKASMMKALVSYISTQNYNTGSIAMPVDDSAMRKPMKKLIAESARKEVDKKFNERRRKTK